METTGKRSVRRVAGMVAAVLGSFLIGLVVAVIAALIADGTQTCSSGDCEDSLVALAALVIAFAVVPVIVMPILALLGRFGRVFVVGSTAGVALIGVGTIGAGMGWYAVFYPLGVAVLVVAFVVANQPSGRTPSPTYRSVVVAVLGLAIVAAAAIPLIVKVNNVRAEARGCAEIQPEVWRAADGDGKQHFWVHSDGQWAHVTSSNFVENKAIQDERNTRAEEVARQLRPRSAWRLGASSADCTICEWFN